MNWKCKAINIPQHKDIYNRTRIKNVRWNRSDWSWNSIDIYL